MRAAVLYLLLAVGLGACLSVGPMALAWSAPALGEGPVLVVGPPWGEGAAGVVKAAGGAIIGPTQAPLSVLTAGVSPEALHAAGAWLILDATALEAICNAEARE